MRPIPTEEKFLKLSTRRSSLRHTSIRRPTKLLVSALAAITLVSAVPMPDANAQIIPPRYGYGNSATTTTVRGTLSTVGRRNNEAGLFVFRAENGEELRALLHEDIQFLTDSPLLNTNSRVEIEGLRDGDILIARDLRILEGSRYLSILRGTVQSDVRNGRFTVTLNNASSTKRNRSRVVQVNARGTNTRLNNIRRGDEVELRGTWQGNGRFLNTSVFNAETVAFLGDSDGNGSYPGDNDYQNGRITTLRGTVTNDSTNGRDNRFRIMLRNNQVIVIRTEAATALNRNDYVEVSGRWDQTTQIFRADNVRVLDVRNDDRNTYRVDFTGTITSFSSNNRMTVRGDNGRTYEIITPLNVDRNASRGDRVRIVGVVEADGTTRAESVVLVDSNSSSSTIDFTGTITELPGDFVRGYYTVRTNEGRVFRVNYNRTTGLRVGDRVRVRGTMTNSNSNVVDAESMVRFS